MQYESLKYDILVSNMKRFSLKKTIEFDDDLFISKIVSVFIDNNVLVYEF